MSELLKPGQILQTTTGLDCVVDRFLGGGGQGEVYQATYCGTDVALKYYFPQVGTETQRQIIQTLIDKQAPDARFLWPLEMIDSDDMPGFGYLMPLRPKRFKNIVDLMKRRIDPSFKALCTAGMQLADSYLKLHSLGFCYGDISFGNAFFDPDSGEILICDNDNVAADGEALGSVLGTPRFMAPEIVRGEARPSSHTDLYSLSVLLFYLFVIHHPLEGQREANIHCLDLPAMNQLYGFNPLFIFDPNDSSNRPVPGLHDNAVLIWPMLPSFVREMFTQAFTAGLNDVHARVRESEWRNTMAQWRDSIFYCACGAENFYDLETLKTAGNPGVCWSCQAALTLPLRMRLDSKNMVMLNHNSQLFPHHTQPNAMYDFSTPTAEVVQHPSKPDIWGLKNLGQTRWVATTKDGSLKDIEPGKSITLSAGVKIDFGSRTGEFRV